jgi:hypothetical protein
MSSNLELSRELESENAAGRIGRATAARLLATSRSAIVRMERRGVLHPTIDAQGQRWFSAIEVSQVAAARRSRVASADPNEIAARAFELFDQHVPLHEVVTELRIAPERVRRLRHDWQDMQRVDSLILGRVHVAQIARAIGTVRSPDELAARVCALARGIDEAESRANDAEFLIDSIIDELSGDGEVKASDLVQRVRELVARATPPKESI